MKSPQEVLLGFDCGTALHFHGVTAVPLLAREPHISEPDYLLLEDGVSQGVVKVTELHASGSVPELRLENKASVPVMVIDGEELIGAKQNRVLNLTVLAPARSVTVIPVSCVEAGRWSMATPDFRPATHVMYTDARAERMSQVSASMRFSGSRMSDQGAVWRNIAIQAMRMGSKSPTQAMSGIYEKHATSMEAFVRAFGWQPRQIGAIFFINEQLVGVDAFDHPEVMRRFLPKLVRSYALEAVDCSIEKYPPASGRAWAEFIASICKAHVFSDKGLGLGTDVRFNGDDVVGGALWVENRYVHICAFSRSSNRCGS